MDTTPRLSDALRRYWGYEAFRPLQERVVNSLMSRRDVCVVMPTGGGKSLCYQLPAAVSESQAVIVVSPLIALMQDQVAQLDAMGLPAAFLNSSQSAREQAEIAAKAARGEFRLLYLSPERLALQHVVEWLKKVPVNFFAIDEAHCISEWGHEFRPDYRQLKRLRAFFPDKPIAAFTASATQRVRHDIIQQLGLRDPDKYIASFHRHNLRYLVKQCSGEFEQMQQLTAALREHTEGNVIVYAPTIKKVESIAEELNKSGFTAVPYHAKLAPDVRRQNQERWMNDEMRILVGTIAFGLGINKPNVRCVIHLALPKSVEQYYQEAGRAGRDGSPADCLMLWQARDSGLHAHFIGQIEDHDEKERAWERFNEIKKFVMQSVCRHLQVCLHFGERPKWKTCNSCDVCSGAAQWMAAEIPALRKPNKSLEDDSAEHAVDDGLRESLRQWRKRTAERQGVPAFVIMHDTTLEAVCRTRPTTLAELRAVPGIGQKKLETYGHAMLQAIARFQSGVKTVSAREPLSGPAAETLRMLNLGHSIEQVALLRKVTTGTVYETVAKLIELGELELQAGMVPDDRVRAIEEACSRMGSERLRPIKDALPEKVSFQEIRMVVAEMKRRAGTVSVCE